MEHDTTMARFHVPPTDRERADVGAHRSNIYPFVFDWSSFLGLVSSVSSRERGPFDGSIERSGNRAIVFPLSTSPSEH